ncbi:hypothetical protein [Nitrincola tapanii]|uniref:Uncharacterized protein n=1 Tax=Nitrincola tapanii TaxID=1708751 RepID=A0A5A9W6I2_9GAMM|nr:hypothetical protein [Nitrincola tapanii]KAA0876292.1 hypothetical protein E1H14_00725 [Nitrincola tapanii]
MVERKNSGGSAFPYELTKKYYHGMTMRDYFAAQAMQGLAAASLHSRMTPEMVAKRAYEWADAMLNERDGKA